MKKEERVGRIFRSLHLITQAEELLEGIVWESQEEQSDHFDKLQKTEQIMLCECHHSLKLAFTSLESLYNAYRYSTFYNE